jgi:hypothetical protein
MNFKSRATKFTWGDTVRVRSGAASEFRPGAIAAVCGITEPDAMREVYFYTIEFTDGTSAHIPEEHLEHDPSR